MWWHAGLHVSDFTHCLQILLDQSVRKHLLNSPHPMQQAFMASLVHIYTSHDALHLLADSHPHQHVVRWSTWCLVHVMF
jgi:hypothetical protein